MNYHMHLRRKINIWLITYSVLLIAVTIFTLLLARFVDKKIHDNNLLPVSEIPKFNKYDNTLALESHKIKVTDYDLRFYLEGYIIDTSNLEKSIIYFRMPYQYYKVIQYPLTITATTIFGNFEATIISIENEVLNGYLYLYAEFDNTDLNLLKGISVTSQVIYDTKYNAIAIPKRFVYKINELNYVYKANANMTDFVLVPIEIVYEINPEGFYIIFGDIFEGDTIIKMG